MTDPYQVLGISRDADQDEIKKAYRKLSRQYHPDANINNPNKDQAEARFKEVQAAYNQIMKEKESGSSYGSYGYGGGASSNPYGSGGFYGGFGSYGGAYGGYQNAYGQNSQNQSQFQDEDALKYRAATNYINAGSYMEALHVLDSISSRDAQWYYLSALANARMGNNINAREYARKASEMEPDNILYRQLQSQLESGGQWYQDMGQSYGMPTLFFGDACWRILCAYGMCQCCCPGASCCYIPIH